MARSLIVEILGNATGFSKELDRAAGKTRQMGKVAGVAGLAIAGGLAVGLEKSVKAAADAQVSTAKMDAAFTASGQSSKAYASQITAAEDAGRKLGFSNTDIRDSLGSLEVATHNGTKAISDLSAAEDIARFKHLSLADASKTLTMTMSGSTRAAHMLGIQTITVTTAQDKVRAAYTASVQALENAAGSTAKMTIAQKQQFDAEKAGLAAKEKDALVQAKLTDKNKQAAQVIDLVRNKLHGQAQDYANTAAGGMAQFHAQTEAIEENLGSALLPTLGSVSQKLADVTGWLSKHTTMAKIAVIAIGVLATTLMAVSVASKIATTATTLWNLATKAATAAQWLLNAALDANPIGLVVIALAALAAAFVIAWEKSKTFRDIVKGVWDDVKNATGAFVNFFTSSVPHAFELVKTKIVNAFTDVKHWLGSTWAAVEHLVTAPFDALASAASNGFGIPDKLRSAYGSVKSWLGSTFSGIGSALKQLLAAPIDAIIGAIDGIALPSGVSIHTKHILGVPVPDGFSVQWSHPFHIPMLAQGGIAMGPTLALIGEKGPEAVVPLGRHGAGGGDVNVTVHIDEINGTADTAFARTLASELATQLRGGRVPQLQQAIQAIA